MIFHKKVPNLLYLLIQEGLAWTTAVGRIGKIIFSDSEIHYQKDHLLHGNKPHFPTSTLLDVTMNLGGSGRGSPFASSFLISPLIQNLVWKRKDIY